MGACHYAPDGWCDDPKCVEGCKKRRGAPGAISSNLSTPVYKHLNGVESWDNASKDARIAFYGEMKGKAYGIEPTRNAWDWFLNGWNGRSAPETPAYPACIGENGPMTSGDCARWLEAKYARHRELEDQASAQMIRNQAAEIHRLRAMIGDKPSAEETGAPQNEKCQHDLQVPGNSIVLTDDNTRAVCVYCAEEWLNPVHPALSQKASEDRGRPVRPHRSGGGLPAPATERPIELIEPWSPEKASERPPLVYPDRWPCKYPRIAGSIAQDCEYPNCDCGPSENGKGDGT